MGPTPIFNFEQRTRNCPRRRVPKKVGWGWWWWWCSVERRRPNHGYREYCRSAEAQSQNLPSGNSRTGGRPQVRIVRYGAYCLIRRFMFFRYGRMLPVFSRPSCSNHPSSCLPRQPAVGFSLLAAFICLALTLIKIVPIFSPHSSCHEPDEHPSKTSTQYRLKTLISLIALSGNNFLALI